MLKEYRIYENDLIDLIYSFMKKDLRNIIEYCLQTHNSKPLLKIIEIFEENKF